MLRMEKKLSRKELIKIVIGIMITIMSFLISGCFTDNQKKSNNSNQEVYKVAVNGIEVLEKTIILENGTSTKASVNIIPLNATNKELTWVSTNTKAAIVTNEIITGVSDGKTTIIVTTKDGNFSDMINVTIVTATLSSINLAVDKKQIKSNNIDIATFSTKAYDQFGKEITGKPYIKYYANNELLSSNTLKTSSSGIYKIKAKYNNIESNEITVAAIENIEIYEFEPNDTFDAATKIEYDANCYGSSLYQSENDCYVFNAIGKEVFLHLIGYNQTFKIEIYHKETGTIIDNNISGGDEKLKFETNIGEDYIINIKSGSDGLGRYKFQISKDYFVDITF